MTLAATPPPATSRTTQIVLDIGERILFLLLFVSFALAFATSAAHHPHNVIALISETVLCFFMLTRPLGGAVTLRAADWVLALSAMTLPLLSLT